MSSGMYSAVSGAMARLQMMDTITDNLSNGQTSGFKKGGAAFRALLEQPIRPQDASGVDYVKIKEGFSDFNQGKLTKTGVPLQLAIEGDGFFKVRDDNGQIFFTRQGILSRDTFGNLRTQQGMKLLDEDGHPMVIPPGNVVIDEEGLAQLPDGEQIRIPVYTVPDNKNLERVGGALFRMSQPADAVIVQNPRVFQGYVEDSNVNIMQEMAQMKEALRAFEACQKMMKNFSEINARANEIGTIG